MKLMPSIVLIPIVSGLLLLPFPAGGESVAADRNARFVTVAVLDFDSSTEDEPELGSQIGHLLTTFLSTEARLITVERAELDKILSEQELGLSGTVDAKTAAVVGQLTGAKVLVTGRVFVMGTERVMVAKIMSTETSRVFGEAVLSDTDDSPARAVLELAEKIVDAIESNSAVLLASAESRDDLVGRLKSVARKRALPTVSVNIEETTVGTPRVDGTAETEISHLLQELGFKLIDPTRSRAKADVEITGQASSEFGARRGNLISCRGSVEIKAVDKKAGTILAVDRQSEVSVDLAERFAAQAALQQSAARLVERLVEKLVASQ
jgi:predicted aconitase with swiveling domain